MGAIVIGVAGGSGSGKTTVSHAILDRVGREHIVYLQHDSYYRDRSDLTFEERTRQNYDHPDSLENELLVQHIHALRDGQPVLIPVYDFATHLRSAETRLMEPRPVVLLEGILIFADRSRSDLMDIKIFVDTDSDLRFIRRLMRDISERGRTMESVCQQYMDTVRPMHLEFVEPSKRYADVIIPEGGFNTIAIDMVAARVESMLAGNEQPPAC
jgi:uridine kinase